MSLYYHNQNIFKNNLSNGIIQLDYVKYSDTPLENLDFSKIHTYSLNLSSIYDKETIFKVMNLMNNEINLNFMIGNNKIMVKILDESIQLWIHKNLKIQKIHAWGIELEDLKPLSDYILHKNCVLTFLNIGSNKIENFTPLMEALTIYNKLEELYLNQNLMNDLKISPICVYLQNTTTLKFLSLQQCYMNFKEHKLLFNALAENTSITSLDVVYIDLKDLRYLNNFIQKNKTIKKLLLSSNPIEKGWNDFFESLKINTSLEELSLSKTKMNIHIANQLFTALVEQKSIKILNLEKNLFGNSDHDIIFDFDKFISHKIIEKIHFGHYEYSLSYTFLNFIVDNILNTSNKINCLVLKTRNLYCDFSIKMNKINELYKKNINTHEKKEFILNLKNQKYNKLILYEIFEYLSEPYQPFKIDFSTCLDS